MIVERLTESGRAVALRIFVGPVDSRACGVCSLPSDGMQSNMVSSLIEANDMCGPVGAGTR